MSTIIDYILRAKDEASAAVRNLGAQAEKTNTAMGKLNTENQHAATSTDKLREAQIKEQAAMRATAKAYWQKRADQRKAVAANKRETRSIKELEDRLKMVRQKRSLLDSGDLNTIGKYNREIDHLNTKLRNLGKEGLGDPNASSGRNGLSSFLLRTGVLAAGGRIAFAALEKGAEQERQKTMFSNAYGEAGNGLYRGLNNQRGSLGDGAMSMGRQLADSGMATEEVVTTMRRIGDVANGSEDKLGNLVDTFARLKKEGKLTQEMLSDLEKNGFSPLNIINRTTGESFKSLFDRLDQGKITVRDVMATLNQATNEGGKFFGNLNRLDDDVLGRWGRLKDYVSQIASDWGEGVLRDASDVADSFTFLKKSASSAMGVGVTGLMKDILFGSDYSQPQIGAAPDPAFSSFGRPKTGSMDIVQQRERQAELERREADKKKSKSSASMSERINAVSGGGARNYTFHIGSMIREIVNNYAPGQERQSNTDMVRSLEEQLVRLLASVSANTARI